MPLEDFRCSPTTELAETLLFLMAVADEACAGVGIPASSSDLSSEDAAILEEALQQLDWTHNSSGISTLGRRISDEAAVVLPKLHTPQSGLVIRSFSHNLALVKPRQVKVRWHWTGFIHEPLDDHAINVLILPWPERLRASQFAPAPHRLENMDETKFGIFSFNPSPLSKEKLDEAVEILKKAEAEVGQVGCVILPEMALSESDFKVLAEQLMQAHFDIPGMENRAGKQDQIAIIGGVASSENDASVNSAVIWVGARFETDPLSGWRVKYTQEKSSRWKLTASQIEQYNLGGILDPTRSWWESHQIGSRRLDFYVVNPWLTFAVLICEDLARPDPLADILRAVGPNLAICLLMDGPQLEARWPGRCATVLADDPGSSVLTLTSLGMAQLCRPAGKKPSRTVALWKDPSVGGGGREIELPDGKSAAVLSLTRCESPEWTADGRFDSAAAASIRLTGVTFFS